MNQTGLRKGPAVPEGEMERSENGLAQCQWCKSVQEGQSQCIKCREDVAAALSPEPEDPWAGPSDSGKGTGLRGGDEALRRAGRGRQFLFQAEGRLPRRSPCQEILKGRGAGKAVFPKGYAYPRVRVGPDNVPGHAPGGQGILDARQEEYDGDGGRLGTRPYL
jgi:hypothetical protein